MCTTIVGGQLLPNSVMDSSEMEHGSFTRHQQRAIYNNYTADIVYDGEYGSRIDLPLETVNHNMQSSDWPLCKTDLLVNFDQVNAEVSYHMCIFPFIFIQKANCVDCSLINFSQNFINLKIKDQAVGNWRLTAFYGYSDSGRRRESWDLLRSLSTLLDDPWCIIGDFNDHLSTLDKRGGPERPPWLIRGFQDAVNDCNLLDIPLIGYQFTWFKSIGTESSKEARLDRALVTSSWQTLYPNATLQTLVAPISDHTPLLLQLDPLPWRKPYRCFRFNNAWLLEPELD
ncbi:endonuclease/exonuclease/phosphatase family protein [Medicago truncatula]|uniref:Endonuclease/exonuclease/phosphatase family protein n=1 Tax=Medicago truncatula TaxID=3880 RepID=A0A072UK22_MEDTR|nr:endonuclease/exonuclease/phosphatase family protein [Medicago truncatula]